MSGVSSGGDGPGELLAAPSRPGALSEGRSPHSANGVSSIVFDFGGVVFRWEPRVLLMNVLAHHAPDAAAADVLAGRIFQTFAVGSDWGEFDRGTVDEDTLVERIATRSGLALDEVRSVVDAVPAHLEVQTATLDLMRRLKDAGHRLFYLSNMPVPFADELERIHPFFGWFEAGVFSGRVHLIKPEPAIFDLAAQRFGVDPAQLLFIDDLPHNIDQARASGWQGLVFRGAAQLEKDLLAGGWLPPV
ncbi:MAG: haloacid dehalogenase [Rhizobacter sp.]|nr:haloacid dehalogenase [Rhizobacter sp.]